MKSPLIGVVKGDARDYRSVRLLLEGCSAVISVVGQPKGEKPVFSDTTKNVLRAMTEHNIRRYISLTGLNVDTPFDRKSPKTQQATEWMKNNYPLTTSDKQTEYEVLSGSNVAWTLVRLPWIEMTEDRRKVRVSVEDCPGDNISAADLAHFLVGQLKDDAYLGKAPFIANV